MNSRRRRLTSCLKAFAATLCCFLYLASPLAGKDEAKSLLPLPVKLEAAYERTRVLVERAERDGGWISPSSGFVALNAHDVRSSLEGRRYRARARHFDGQLDFHHDGTLYLRGPRLVVLGRWRVEDNKLCMALRPVDICGPLYSNGIVLLTSNEGRVSPLMFTLLNPEPLAAH